jgi:chromosome partitioning protein
MFVISFASSKGGAGRTTCAIILATTLAQEFNVYVIDADPALRLKSWALKAGLPKRLTFHASEGGHHILDEINAAPAKADFVIIDLEGDGITRNATVIDNCDLVIIPMGDDPQDEEEAEKTLKQLTVGVSDLRREIPARILFARTKASGKSPLEKRLNARMRRRAKSFRCELAQRTAFSALHSFGRTLYDLDKSQVSEVASAIDNAEEFTQEVLAYFDECERNKDQVKSSKDPSVQMSVRMKESIYLRFQTVSTKERRNNGDMLERMMRVYLDQKAKGLVSDPEK